MKKVLRILLVLLLIVFLLFIGVFIAIQTPYVQTYITQKVLVNLNEQFGTSLTVGEVDIDLWGDVNLYDVKATDHHDLEFIQIPHLTADLNLWDIYKNSSDITIQQLDLENAKVQVKTYPGEATSNFIQFIDKFVVEDSDTESNFKIRGNVNLIESELSIINYNLAKEQQVWLDAKKVNGSLKNIDVSGDTYVADIRQLRFEAKKNGEDFSLQELTADFKMHDSGIFLEDLKLKTQSSDLDGYIKLQYDSMAQFDDFGNKVLWDLQLGDDDQIGYKDLRYFMPGWEKDEIIHIAGHATGTLNDLNLDALMISNGETIIATDHINLGSLLEGNFNIHTEYIDATTSYDELIRILPKDLASSLTDYLQRFGLIHYKGSLQLDDKNLKAIGQATTALGDANVELTMLDYTASVPTYFGKIKTSGFNLKRLTDTQELGHVAGTLNFDGRGFDINTMRIQAKGKLNYLDLMNERYQNISVDGTLHQEKFDGLLAINDPNAQMDYDGIFDFSQKHLKVDFTSRVDFINLTHFNLIQEKNSWFRGNIQGEAVFSDLNDLDGQISITDIVFNSDTLNLALPEAHLDIHAVDDMQRNVLLNIPGYMNADILGKFELQEIPTVLQNGIGNFLVDYKKKPVSPNQVFTFNIHIEDNIVSYFVPELYLQPETYVIGSTNDAAGLFEVQMHSPFVQYANYKADSVDLFISTEHNNSFDLDVRRMNIEDFIIKEFKVRGNKMQDTIIANANFYSGEENFGEFDLNFYQTFTDAKQVKTGFASSTIQLDGREWVINPDNDQNSNYAILNFDKQEFSANNILIQSEDQLIRVNGDYLNQDDFRLDADLENVSLAKIIPKSLLGDLTLNGIANGSIDVIKTQTKLKPEADLRIDSIEINNNHIGNFVTNATYDIEEKIFDITGSLDRDNINTLFLTGSIDNKGDEPELDMVANLDAFNIGILSVFLEEVLSDWKGTLSGDVSIKGMVDDPSLSGFITANDVGFKVVYLGTQYLMKGENDLILQKEPGTSGYITLPDVGFVESSTQTQASVDGLLIFSNLTDWFLDLDFDTDRLLVMNSTVEDNELFYGKVFAGGKFNMYGPASDMELTGYGVDVLSGSNVSLNTGATSTVSDNKFIQFYSYDENGLIAEAEDENIEVSGFSLDLDFNVDEGSTVNLVIDAQSNDMIEARGHADDFRIQMNRAGKLNIEGEYVISEGIYNYREAVVIDKNFELEEGGYIRFDGDPYNASMDLKAVYSRYVNNLGDYLGLTTTQATMVDLGIGITGNLEELNMDFFVEAPSASNQVKSALQAKLDSNADERIKQASFLLVMGRFGTEDLIDAENATGAATASAFELLGKQVGNIFSSIIPGFELNPTYLQSTNSSSQADRIQTQYNLALNERLKINGAVGTPLGSENNEQVTMQVELDYDISKNADGGLILRGFTRPTTLGIENFKANSTFAQSYGAGIVYRRSFNTLRELFSKEEEDEKQGKRTTPQPPQEAVVPKDSIQDDFSLIRFDN